MTKFDELMDIITRNKSKSAKKIVADDKEDDDIEIEVSGTETGAPLVASADSELDPDIIDMLYTKPRNIPNRGEGASSWDSNH